MIAGPIFDWVPTVYRCSTRHNTVAVAPDQYLRVGIFQSLWTLWDSWPFLPEGTVTTSLPFGRLSLLASFTSVYLEATSDVPLSWDSWHSFELLDHRQGQSLSLELLLWFASAQCIYHHKLVSLITLEAAAVSSSTSTVKNNLLGFNVSSLDLPGFSTCQKKG